MDMPGPMVFLIGPFIVEITIRKEVQNSSTLLQIIGLPLFLEVQLEPLMAYATFITSAQSSWALKSSY
jgi:hypothetical protein